jgi:putative addiction module killer protein
MPLSSLNFSPSHEAGEPHQSGRDRLCEHRWMDQSVRKYVRVDQTVPYQQWFDRLDTAAATKVSTAFYRLQKGNLSRVKWFGGIGEYVIDWGPGYRIYLAQDGEDRIILFGGGTKKHQQVDITRAKLLHDEYKLRKKAADGEILWN